MQNRILFFLHSSRSKFAKETVAPMFSRSAIQRKGIVVSSTVVNALFCASLVLGGVFSALRLLLYNP